MIHTRRGIHDNTGQSPAPALANALLLQSADGPHELPPVEMCVCVCVVLVLLVVVLDKERKQRVCV